MSATIRICPWINFLALSLLGGVIQVPASPAQSGTFSIGDESWKIVEISTGTQNYRNITFGPITPSWLPSAGNPNGCIFTPDPGGDEFYFEAPPAFVVGLSQMYGGSLNWDIRSDQNGSFQAADVILIAPSMVLVRDDLPQTTTSWQTFGVNLTEVGWHIDMLPNGVEPTADQFKSVLATLTNVRIRGEFVSGEESTWLDNVIPICATLAFTQSPLSHPGCLNKPTSFHVATTGTAVTYQWRKNGVDLVNGGTISGAHSPHLTISSVQASDAGSYDCVATDVCSDFVVSGPATLNVVTSLTGDLNGDGTVDLVDLSSLLSQYGQSCN